MSLKLGQPRSYKWPVEWTIPADDGRHQKIGFDAEFKRLAQTRIDEIYKSATGGGAISDEELVGEVLVGWGTNVLDENDQPLAFTPANIAAVLDIQGARAATVRAFFDSLTGAKEKN